jgi:hypothetical protein
LKHLATVDTSGGPVTAEIINFHLVSDMRTRFNKFVKDHGCTYVAWQNSILFAHGYLQPEISKAHESRTGQNQEKSQISEWHLFYSTRYLPLFKLMMFTSVTVTPEAQRAYLEKNPSKAPSKSVAGPGPLTEGVSRKRSANQAELGAGPSTSKASSTSKKAKN